MHAPQLDGSLASLCQHLFTDSWLYLRVRSSVSLTGQMDKWVNKVWYVFNLDSSEVKDSQSGYILLQEIS